MNLSVTAIIVSLLVGLITIATLIWRGGGLARDVQTLMQWYKLCPINTMQDDITQLKADNKVFWQVISPHLATIIHSPNHKERDDLVDKLVDGTLTPSEALTLELLLEINIKENHDEGKRLASALLLARTKTLIKRGE